MGNLTLLCVARTEDDAALYGFAFGYNNSMSTMPELLVILLKAAVPPTPPSSLSSLNWSLVSLVFWSKVQSIYSTSDLTNTACAASSTGVFTFISQQYKQRGGFRYDPTLGSGSPPAPSTSNFEQSDQYWVNMSLGLNFNWTTSTANVFPKLFYVPITANSTGTGAMSGYNLVLSSLNNNTVLFAQENQARGFDYTGTLQTPLAYMQKMSAIAYSSGRFYLIGVPVVVSSGQQAVVLSMPIYDGHVSTLPPVADLKYYNSTPVNASASSDQSSCLTGALVTATVTDNSLYCVCMEPSILSSTGFWIQNLATDTLIGPQVTISASIDGPDLDSLTAFQSLFDFIILTPPPTSSPSSSTPKGSGFLIGSDGPHEFPLDGSSPFFLGQKDWITSIPGLDVNQVDTFNPLDSGTGGSTLSAGAWAGIIIGTLLFFTCVYTLKRRQRTVLRNRAQARAAKANRALQQQRAQLAGHVFPDLNGSVGVGSEQKGGATNIEMASSLPLSPPPLQPRPQQSSSPAGQLSGSPSTSPELSYQPYTLAPLQSPSSAVWGSSQEQLRETLQLTSHPRPRVATTTRT